ncbi:MAG: Mth938-like domain-containing protein [Chloroflexota bacterium]
MRETQTTISHISWGRIEVSVDGQTLSFKDCKIWPGGAIEWDWTLTGTHHRPGIQVADLEDVLAHDPDVIILSRGMQRRLQTMSQVEEHLSQRNIPYHIKETNRAAELFNALAQEGKRPGGLFHSTC